MKIDSSARLVHANEFPRCAAAPDSVETEKRKKGNEAQILKKQTVNGLKNEFESLQEDESLCLHVPCFHLLVLTESVSQAADGSSSDDPPPHRGVITDRLQPQDEETRGEEEKMEKKGGDEDERLEEGMSGET
ncbi:unnamed protein product [Pleuronectes platessa]|uniref:Uncharacterized protein n=1 Tax=Pleuronectes platessa TaxID=8262 RepID=A0A9N7YX29_PLEPL|nr:unnamed protein product [Pleuronectes platessa]